MSVRQLSAATDTSTLAPYDATYVTLSVDATLTAERVLTGTSNQITITDNGAGSTVVLSTPQNIHTAATPTFSSLNLSATSNQLVLQSAGVTGTLTWTPATSSKIITFPNVTGTVALTSNKLSDFAATTSAELAGIISDETGSGLLVFGTNPVLTTPDINGGTSDALTSLGVRSTGTGAFDMKIANAENLTISSKTLTIELGNADRTLILGSSPSVSGSNTGDQTDITGNAGTVTVADETTDTTCFIGFYTAASGSLSGKTNANLTFNSNTGVLTLVAPVLGTPTSGSLTNCTGLPVAGITASTITALGVGSIELGHATDTTIARVSAGVLSVEGNTIYAAGGTDVAFTDGGTGISSWTQYLIPYAATTTSIGQIAIGTAGQVLTSNGAGVAPTFQAAASADVINSVNDFRLTLTSGTSITTADVTGATTIYLTPHTGNSIALYDGANWALLTSSEVSLALGTLTSGLPYDVFAYDNAGTLTLEFLAWTNNTTRATALVRQNGVWCKTGVLTRRYVGTFYTTSTTTTEDSYAKRFLWNVNNRIRRPLKNVTEITDSWTYTTAAFREANANTANRLQYVCGLSEDLVEAFVHILTYRTVDVHSTVGIGIDVTNADSSQIRGMYALASEYEVVRAEYRGYPGIGFHFLSWLEYSNASGTVTWFGDGGQPILIQGGISGIM